MKLFYFDNGVKIICHRVIAVIGIVEYYRKYLRPIHLSLHTKTTEHSERLISKFLCKIRFIPRD